MKKLIYSALLAAALLPATHASAQTITYDSQQTVAAGGTAPGTEYDFFGQPSGDQPAPSLSDFTITPIAGQHYGGGSGGDSSYSSLVAPGGGSAFYTGILYDGYTQSNYSGKADPILSFTADESSFNIFVLTGNTNAQGVVDEGLTLSSSGGGSPATVSFSDSQATNVFTEFTVTGATVGDTFTLSAIASGTPTGNNAPYAYVGGVTFEEAAPEPSTYALLGAGVIALLAFQRFRRIA